MLGRGLILLLLIGVWVMLTGSFGLPALMVGLFGGLLAIYAFGARLFFEAPGLELRDLGARIFWAAILVPFFLFKVFSSAVDVAGIVLTPRIALKPCVVRIPTKLTSRLATTLLANLITLTPGTLSMDYDWEQQCYFVHILTVDTVDLAQPERIIADMELLLRRVFQ